MLRVQRGEECSVIYGLVASIKAKKKKVIVGDAWFRISPLSLFSLSQLGFWICWCRLLFWSGPTVKKYIFYIVFLFWLDRIGSDQIGFSLFFVFYRKCHRLAEKLLLIIFIFWQISSTFCCALILCAEPPFFHFEESLSTDNIRWMLLWALVAIIIWWVR